MPVFPTFLVCSTECACTAIGYGCQAYKRWCQCAFNLRSSCCCCGPALLLRPCPAAAAMPCCLPIVHLRFVNVFRALSPFQRSSSCLTGHQPGALRTKRMFARDPQARCRTPKRMLSLIPRVSWASARPLASPSAMK